MNGLFLNFQNYNIKVILKMALRKRSRKSLNHQKRHSSCNKRQKIQVEESEEEVPEFVVECIKDHRINIDSNEIQFLVKWKDYGEEDNTWQNFFFFSQDQPDMVEQYLLKMFTKNGALVSTLIFKILAHFLYFVRTLKKCMKPPRKS